MALSSIAYRLLIGFHNQTLNFEQAVAYLSSLENRGWRLGLDRMQAFVERAGLAGAVGGPSGPQYVHIAGTNGKGSTAAMLAAILANDFSIRYVAESSSRASMACWLSPAPVVST